MKNEKRNFTGLTILVVYALLLIFACLLVGGGSALGQENVNEQVSKSYDDTYGPNGEKITSTSIPSEDPQKRTISIKDANGNLRERHTTQVSKVTKKLVYQEDEFFDCHGSQTAFKSVQYDVLGNEIHFVEKRYKDGKLISGYERSVDENGKKYSRNYNPQTQKWEDVAFNIRPSEIIALRDTSVCKRPGAEPKILITTPRPKPPLIPDLSGEWVCTKYCPAGGEGNVARIVQQGRRLNFTNEGGMTSDGRFEDDLKTVVATQWEGGSKATIEEGGNAIHWANGTIWVRKTSDKTRSRNIRPQE